MHDFFLKNIFSSLHLLNSLLEKGCFDDVFTFKNTTTKANVVLKPIRLGI
jgi:hypothetical protein